MSTIRILIVEDEPLIAEDLADCLEDSGIEVAAVAYNGEEGLEELAKTK